ncbi:MAG: hypothetical protein IJS78_05820 [Clostridia bacterium]|nr:hypothetical protein [Clostridia bacterium]
MENGKTKEFSSALDRGFISMKPAKDASAKKFPISFWNYRRYGDGMTPDEVKTWAELGLTVAMAPMLSWENDPHDALLPFLDEAEKAGIKLILSIEGVEYHDVLRLGKDEVRRRLEELFRIYRHPALFGVYAGDEPSGEDAFRAAVETVKMMKEIAPEYEPYLNLHGGMDLVPEEEFGGKPFGKWLADFARETGFSIFSYGHYDQVDGTERGIESFYREIVPLRAAADAAGVDVWNTQLSSAHYTHAVPTEYQFMWQITVAAALGSRGIVWFRLYDRPHGPNYHGSPIDEYGYRTASFLPFLHANRRFADHFGELMMRLRFREAFFSQRDHAGFGKLPEGARPFLARVDGPDAIVSFFSDRETGEEYIAVVNPSQTEQGVFRPVFDREKYSLFEVMFNGSTLMEYTLGTTDDPWDGIWLYPGQMTVLKPRAK